MDGAVASGPDDEVALLLAQEHDRIAEGLNDVVVRRLFSAGLALDMALGLMGDHCGAGQVREAADQLDLAIRDIRTVVFDHCQRGWTPASVKACKPAG